MTDEELIKTFKQTPNYSWVSKRFEVKPHVIEYRISKLRSQGVKLPPTIRHTEESKRQIGQTNKAKYGEDVYKRIGAIGGSLGHTGGFYQDHELARTAGRKGGKISKRRKYDNTDTGLL